VFGLDFTLLHIGHSTDVLCFISLAQRLECSTHRHPEPEYGRHQTFIIEWCKRKRQKLRCKYICMFIKCETFLIF
jgi:hypothetical protein